MDKPAQLKQLVKRWHESIVWLLTGMILSLIAMFGGIRVAGFQLCAVETAKTAQTPDEEDETDFPYEFAFSGDGSRYVVRGRAGRARICDSETDSLLQMLGDGFGEATSVAFGGDRYIASGYADGRVVVWEDRGTGFQPISEQQCGSRIFSVHLTADGRLAAAGSYDGTTVVWDVYDGRVVKRISGGNDAVDCVRFTRDGRRLATGGDKGTLAIHDLSHDAQPASLVGHTQRVLTCAFSTDERKLVSGIEDGTVRVWDVSRAVELLVVRLPQCVVTSVDFAGASNRVAFCTNTGEIRVWDVELDVEVFESRQPSTCNHIRFADNDNELWCAASGASRLLRFWVPPPEVAGAN